MWITFENNMKIFDLDWLNSVQIIQNQSAAGKLTRICTQTMSKVYNMSKVKTHVVDLESIRAFAWHLHLNIIKVI